MDFSHYLCMVVVEFLEFTFVPLVGEADMENRAHKEKLFFCFAVLLIGFIILFQFGLTVSARNTTLQLEEEVLHQSSAPFQSMFEGFVDRQHVSDLLIEAIITVESDGNPRAVGRQGERGLMQIMRGTWKDTTAKMFGRPLSFDLAFDPVMNQRVGRAYLNYLQYGLKKNRDQWGAGERDLLLGCYNAGPENVRRAGFKLQGLPGQSLEYIQRVSSLHDELLKEFARPAEQMMVMGPPAVPPSGS